MVITCPLCRSQYRINPSESNTAVAKIKCPDCEHTYEISLAGEIVRRGGAASSCLPLVLVVDDARFFLEMVEDILKDLPLELVLAADGNEAWQKISTLVPKLVLLDLNIPGKTGRKILQSLHDSPNSGQVKVIAMSAVERGEEVASEVRQLGATDFISKSFTPSELQNRVRTILDI